MAAPERKRTATSLFAGKEIQKTITLDIAAIKEKKKIQSFMLEPTIKDHLLQHFEQQGITWGAGLRIALIEYMRKEKIIK